MIKMEPRERVDRGGILMMPLRKNVPLPKEPDWKLVICMECGRECWERPLPKGFILDPSVRKMCTACALEKVVETSHGKGRD